MEKYAIDKALAEQMARYLSQRPWIEVNAFMAGLQQGQVVNIEETPTNEQQGSDSTD